MVAITTVRLEWVNDWDWSNLVYRRSGWTFDGYFMRRLTSGYGSEIWKIKPFDGDLSSEIIELNRPVSKAMLNIYIYDHYYNKAMLSLWLFIINHLSCICYIYIYQLLFHHIIIMISIFRWFSHYRSPKIPLTPMFVANKDNTVTYKAYELHTTLASCRISKIGKVKTNIIRARVAICWVLNG